MFTAAERDSRQMEQQIAAIQTEENIRQPLLDIKEMVKEDAEKWLPLLQDNKTLFKELLTHEDAKVRKNAVWILGHMQEQSVLDAIWQAYENEGTLYVKAAYPEAMAQYDCTAYLEALQDKYQNLKKQTWVQSEIKHIRAERKALEALLELQQKPNEKRVYTDFDEEVEVVLTTDKGFSEITARQIPYGRKTVTKSAVRIVTKRLQDLLKVRTYREILFPLNQGQAMEADADVIAEALVQGNLLSLLTKHLGGTAAYRFRIRMHSVGPDEKQTELMKKVAFAMEEASRYRLKNSVDNYEVELRFIRNQEGMYRGYVKFMTLQDERFSYRIHSLPVSIHPVRAAVIMQLARPYIKEDAAVLDPFCGVGTMLIERQKMLSARTLYGIDIYGDAIEGARANTYATPYDIAYIQKDFFDFTHRHRFDEILTNMPIRGKKSEEEMYWLYRDFFAQAKKVLEADGVIIMYTNENQCMKRALLECNDYVLEKDFCIRAKDGYYLYIIKIKEQGDHGIIR